MLPTLLDHYDLKQFGKCAEILTIQAACMRAVADRDMAMLLRAQKALAEFHR